MRSFWSQPQQDGMMALRRSIGDGEYAEVGVPNYRRMRRQSVNRPFQQTLLAHRLLTVHRTPCWPHRQSGFEIVGDHDSKQGPVRLPVLVRSRGKDFTQLGSMRRAHRRTIQKESARWSVYRRRVQLGDELLKNVIAAFFHNRKRQSLSCLIIGPRITGRRLSAFAPVSNPFTGPRLKSWRGDRIASQVRRIPATRRPGAAGPPTATAPPAASTHCCCVFVGLRFVLAPETGLAAVAGIAKQAGRGRR